MKPLVVANWKMNPQNLTEAKRLFSLVRKGVGDIKKTEVVICPPFVYLLGLLLDFFGGRRKSQVVISQIIKLGAQDVFWKEKGAYTGEVSPLMLKNLGVKYIIIGHSERRQNLNETDEIINKKIKAVIGARLNPILCIGETKEEREKGKTRDVLKRQITLAFQNVQCSMFHVSGLVIAYEPIWAIGTGNSCDIDEAMNRALLIRKTLTELYNTTVAGKVLILYGGSVNSKNAANYIKMAGMDGLLVGGASLRPKEFIKIVKTIAT